MLYPRTKEQLSYPKTLMTIPLKTPMTFSAKLEKQNPFYNVSGISKF
jgi:hypothetical protein